MVSLTIAGTVLSFITVWLLFCIKFPDFTLEPDSSRITGTLSGGLYGYVRARRGSWPHAAAVPPGSGEQSVVSFLFRCERQVNAAQMLMLGTVGLFLGLLGWAQFDVIQPLLKVHETRDTRVAEERRIAHAARAAAAAAASIAATVMD